MQQALWFRNSMVSGNAASRRVRQYLSNIKEEWRMQLYISSVGRSLVLPLSLHWPRPSYASTPCPFATHFQLVLSRTPSGIMAQENHTRWSSTAPVLSWINCQPPTHPSPLVQIGVHPIGVARAWTTVPPRAGGYNGHIPTHCKHSDFSADSNICFF